ncbi:Longin domain [Sesbania bispinosa]|nr:Longin domain [Sesbania bispinosa]
MWAARASIAAARASIAAARASMKRQLSFSSMKPPFAAARDYHRFAPDQRRNPEQDTEAIVVKTPLLRNDQLHQLSYELKAICSWALTEAEAILLAFQHYLVMLGTTVLIISSLVPQMGGGNVLKSPLCCSSGCSVRLWAVLTGFSCGRIPFAFLEDIHKKIVKTYGHGILSAPAYAMNDEFSKGPEPTDDYFSNDPNADRLNRLKELLKFP